MIKPVKPMPDPIDYGVGKPTNRRARETHAGQLDREYKLLLEEANARIKVSGALRETALEMLSEAHAHPWRFAIRETWESAKRQIRRWGGGPR